jgi:hypothetical protein
MKLAPGRSARRAPRFVWIVSGVLAAALAVTAVRLVARGPRSNLDAARQRAAEATAARGTLTDLLAKVRVEPDPMAYAQARAGKDDATTISELINAYAAWASRGDALEARRLIAKQFLDNPNPKVGFEALLRAVALDTTPRKQDPLWRDLVEGVTRQWNPVTYAWGRDLVHVEGSPKARDLLLESLAGVPPGKLTQDQQGLLVTDLIDLYPEAGPDQKAALDRALTAMAGSDVVQILHRQGINQGSAPLAAIQKIEQEVEASRAKYKQVLEQIEKDEREAKETNAREAGKSNR